MGKTNKKDILLIIVGICAFIIVITIFVDFIRVNNKVSEIREQMNEVCEKYLSCPDNIQEAYEEKNFTFRYCKNQRTTWIVI
jgi:uncharacterized membrane protein